MTLPPTTALILIDVQRAWDDPAWGVRSTPGAEANVARLLAAFRATGRPVLHVRHASGNPASPLHPDQPGHAFKPEAQPQPGEPVFTKSVHAAFLGTGLEDHLRAHGITTHLCVSSTARLGSNLGFAVTVVSDASSALSLDDGEGGRIPAETAHRVALAELRGQFAEVRTTEAVLGEL
ncbi:MAG: cysteine hydrolase [Acidobacteriota bacterium]|nr:cysteine hydrolase [Acidobacteriota bacterium]